MRSWGLASFLIVASWIPAAADVSATVERDAASAPQPLGYGAMPGGLHAPSAETLPAGVFGVAALGGYGFRNTLLSEEHKLTRGIGDLALAFAPTELITLALSFDGRYDKHEGLAPGGDDGYVGDPRLFARMGKSFGSIRAGGQLGIWVPGKDAPSVAASAISVEARGLLSVDVGPGMLSFSGGFRLDNSAKSVDDPAKLSAEDRVSLGVSDFHAAVASAHLMIPAGKAFVGLEASTDLFVGSGAPGPIIRAGANGGINLTDQWSVFAFVQAAKVPELDYADVMAGDVTLVPYEPVFTGGIGVSARFGAKRGAGSVDQVGKPGKSGKQVEVIEYADVSGTVTDETGKPVARAKVTIKLAGSTASGASDEQGAYTIAKLAIGKTIDGQTTLDDVSAEVTVEVPGKKPKVTTLTLTRGTNAVAAITLDPVLPPGQLKAVIRAAGTGKPIAGATVKIEPGGQTATTDADGNISIDLPPGTYKATASGTGFKDQTLDVVIQKDGVIVKNFELRK